MPTSSSSAPERPATVNTPGSLDDESVEKEQWNDEGDSWWAPHPVPPSYRDPT